jgi:hypothetical protein
MPAHHDDLRVTSGDTWTIPFSVADVNGNPLDIASTIHVGIAWT